MRAILIDDEYLALAYLNDLLAEIGKIVIEGTYQDPKRALKELEEIAPDVVFLDIDMPEMNAVEATYAKLCDMTQNEFGIPPQAAYQSWYERWSGNEKR